MRGAQPRIFLLCERAGIRFDTACKKSAFDQFKGATSGPMRAVQGRIEARRSPIAASEVVPNSVLE